MSARGLESGVVVVGNWAAGWSVVARPLLVAAAVGATLALLAASASAAPPNDDFENATPISGSTGSLSGTTVGATVQQYEPRHVYQGGGSVWYRFRAPKDGRFVLWTKRSSIYEVAVAVYTGDDLRTLRWVGGGYRYGNQNTDAAFAATKDVTYHIAVAGRYGRHGTFDLYWDEAGSITGRVKDWTDDPIQDACVDAVPYSSVHSGQASARSGPDGSYTLQDLPSEDFKVRFRDCTSPWEGYFEQWFDDVADEDSAARVTADGPSPATGVDAVLTRGARIAGTVTDNTGAPLEHVRVYARRTATNTLRGAMSDGSGAYEIRGLQAGEHRVHAAPQDGRHLWEYHRETTDPDAATLVSASTNAAPSQIDFALDRSGAIAGRVTDTAGEPIHGIMVHAQNRSGYGSHWARTDANGRYEIAEHLHPGNYLVTFYGDPWNSRFDGRFVGQYHRGARVVDDAALVPLARESRASDIDAVLERPGSLSGTVTGADGEPVANVCMTAYSDTGWLLATGRTDQDGAYTLRELPAGDYRVHAMPGCHVWASSKYQEAWYGGGTSWRNAGSTSVHNEQDTPGVDISLPLNGYITGRITNTGGEPLDDICARAQTTSGSWTNWSGRTDDAGRYAIYGLREGTYLVHLQDCSGTGYLHEYVADSPSAEHDRVVEAVDAQRFDVVDATETVAQDEDLVLGGRVSGTVVDRGGSPIEGVCANWARTDADGTYTLVGLEPDDEYTVRFRDCRNVSARFVDQWYDGKDSSTDATQFPVGVGAEKTDVDAILDLPGSVVGRVTDTAGDPLPGMCVSLHTTTHGSALDHAVTGPTGGYVLGGNRNGTHHILARDCSGGEYVQQWYPGGGSNYTGGQAVTIDSRPEGVDVGDMSLRRGGSISGTVTGRGARPFPDVCITATPEAASPLPGPWTARTDDRGAYRLAGLPTATVEVHARDCDPLSRYDPGHYPSGQPAAAPVAAVEETEVTGIDITLDATLAIISLGDAIAAGTGLPDEAGECRQSPSGYASRLAGLLAADFTISSSQVLACDGALTAPSPGFEEETDLSGQVDAVLDPSNRFGRDQWAAVTVTTGWHDLGLGTAREQRLRLCDMTDDAFADSLAVTRDRLFTAASQQIGRLVAGLPRAEVYLTEMYMPLNAQPAYLDDLQAVGSLSFRPCDDAAPGHKARLRMERLVAEVNDAYHQVAGTLTPLQQSRFQIVAVEAAFIGHEAGAHPGGFCGLERPGPEDTWLQYPVDGWRLTAVQDGECLYPNPTGADAIAALIADRLLPSTPEGDNRAPTMSLSHEGAAVLVAAVGDSILGRVEDPGSGVASVAVTMTPLAGGEQQFALLDMRCTFNQRTCWFVHRPPQGAWLLEFVAHDNNAWASDPVELIAVVA